MELIQPHTGYLLVFAVLFCVVTGSWNSQMNPLMTSRCTIQHQVIAHCQISFPALREVVKDQYILGLAQWKSWDFSRVLTALSSLGCLMKVHLLFLLTWELILYSYIHTLTFPKTEWLSCTRFSIFTGNQNLLLMRCLIYEYKVLFTSNVTLVDELFTEVPPKNGFEKRCQSIFKTNMIHIVVDLFSNWIKATADKVQLGESLLFLSHCGFLCDPLLNKCTATWKQFILCTSE